MASSGVSTCSGTSGPGTRRSTRAWPSASSGSPLFSGDAWSYAADGFLTGRGDSPYVFPPAVLHGQIVSAVCRCWRHTVAPYGPIPLLWGGGFSQFTSSPWLLMLTYRLLAVGGLGLLMHAV
ncbi:MAG: hypothetical protein HOV66_08240, partial [Streptomycetaceae bacterium]|nr:hypothetical protein [Streptomycetaceae bacterium]